MPIINRRSASRVLALGLAALFAAADALAQATTDFCGCAASPNSLGNFVAQDASTYPPGTVGARNSPLADFYGGCEDAIRIPLPPDGVLIFDSFTVAGNSSRGCALNVGFVPNAANTPVTLLVKGNVTIANNGRISANGLPGGHASNGNAGAPGQPGPGGFAGGSGAYQIVNFAEIGGNGIGPGGGSGATLNPAALAGGGVLVGVAELRPLLGGSGGGGGRSDNANTGASGGGGGGGAGAILIVANGTIDIQSGGRIWADGGLGGNRNGSSASSGAGGSGGAIRLLANRIQGSGSIFARGASPGNCCDGLSANAGANGRIRLEAIFNTFAADNSTPVAVRAPAPGPLVNPITPTVRITDIDGAATPADPIGFQNAVDMILDAPGIIQVDLATTDVPAGTDVAVTVKPKVGAAPVTQNVTLASCIAGACTAATSFDLAAGAYIVEARATFQTP